MTKKKENPQKAGRKTKYKKDFCKKIIDFFNVEHTREIERNKTDQKGNTFTWYEEVANSLPTFERFATDIDVCVDTLHEWKKAYPEFSEAYKKAQQLQKDMLIDLGMRGLYNPTFTIFTAKNITDMKDKQEVEQTNTQIVYIDPEEKERLNKHIDDVINS